MTSLRGKDKFESKETVGKKSEGKEFGRKVIV